ncbi:aspartyl protease family protein [uncultured Winogradskyella sp.]|uniref:aspartyl protease family protein n=1 Tax=uncultured Winogradskyella sp. TaxID=395353 RepID=UPI0026151BF2|nr:aspartyl protease family protein [uncultured Winogradskyella sp.]
MLEKLKLLPRYFILVYLCLYGLSLPAQDSFFLKNSVSKKINFEFVSNLIIIPLEINDVTLSFILDTGVSKPILFNLSESDSVDLKNTRTFYLHGLGSEGKIKALRSSHNKLKIGDAVGVNQDLFVVYDKTIDFTPRLGVVVHGIIGYDIFKDFVVEINYNSKYIRLHKHNSFKPRSSKKWKIMPINIMSKKPYLDAKVAINSTYESTKLLIDTGSSDALWLFEDKEIGLTPNEDLSFNDYLGKGLSGTIYGKRSKVSSFKLNDFSLKDVNVAFPDSSSVDMTKVHKDRNGLLGGDILKRFNLFFDYTNEKLYLKRNSHFKDPFTYNNSGIVLEHNGTMFVKEEIRVPTQFNKNSVNNTSSNSVHVNYYINHRVKIKPIYKVVEIRKSSNAYISGLRVEDIVISINGKPTYEYSFSEINKILHDKTGKSLRLKILRRGVNMLFKFKLDDAFKKK